ncbi:hypothetical protein LTR91_023887 [Friedmanniomyces endolithicus]|uniref:Uncharacterized protein n=1 Tax=Friedmanniomyces endolithicus TaxID=329885 RepID=A0AAN6F4I6_9PEZI|nr:hypothetical protein LTR35_017988 [Friedmanniomyces endolithicus]KAK0267173.1 hypothetical protein LTS00_017861 [Friedmanniomyces endolithicus]KAK0301918.1 hypothetical protein LTR82_018074 [Friedmanniomyces endolithicus]KAK0302181.1 hypothetical protein LTR01_008915 [Friedmanniomyces endolithicus]KAK0822919.1 hypothetical protein LTR73_008921 [Friedmanniomyces endolithicus]
MASKSISFKIYIIDDDDNHRLAASVDRAKLAFFSDLAVALPQVAPDPSRPEKHSMTLAKGVADGKALARISTWIETNSIKDPQQLTLAGLNIEYSDDVILTYAASYLLRIDGGDTVVWKIVVVGQRVEARTFAACIA